MKQKCFDQGVIQAFTDGELGNEASERVLRHVSHCADCAAMLSECEEESSFAFSLLDDELNVLVPTERLRSKVFCQIDEIERERRTGYFGKLLAGLAGLFDFGMPGLSVAAAVLVIFGMLAIGYGVFRNQDSGSNLAEAQAPVERGADPGPVAADRETGSVVPAPVAVDVSTNRKSESEFSAGTPKASTAVYRTRRGSDAAPAPVSVEEAAGPEPEIVSEDSFIQTIATLDRTVGYGKEMLSPSERISFERDLAVVDNAIVKMREEVRTNPNNQAAREVLKVSYQNKVDLLNSVAEKTELMASLQ